MTVTVHKWVLTLLGILLLPSTFVFANLDSAIQTQTQLSKNFMLKNISRPDTSPGVVVASPSMKDPNYFFHWVRDAALTMDTVVQLYEKGGGQKLALRKLILDYATFSRKNQLTPNLSGGLGEPKFNVDGSAFNDPWGRPQSDGPASRANALIHFANVLLREGEKDFVRVHLFDPEHLAESVIAVDLDYVSKSWRLDGFDIWEETRGNHFYTMMVQRKALMAGARLAQDFKNPELAQTYLNQAQEISRELKTFWDPARQFIFESQNQVAVQPKTGLDVAVILGVLHGNTDDGFFDPTNDQILATAFKLKNSFDEIYKVNHGSRPGTAIGRYPEDRYNGDGDSQGNPWFLTTLAYAELYYRAQINFSKKRVIKVSVLNQPFFEFILKNQKLTQGQTLTATNPIFKKIVRGLKREGDNFFRRVLHHLGPDGSMSEQINRDTGLMQGAQNLTWSHVSFIQAAAWRKISALR
jgi:glucoamylase